MRTLAAILITLADLAMAAPNASTAPDLGPTVRLLIPCGGVLCH